jgi:carbonic anhydrase
VTAEEALFRLKEGNHRFVTGERKASSSWHPGLVDGQRPFAVILGCADSRAPAEYLFDQGLGDLFVVRVAGNIVAPSGVGSIEFAVENFGTNLVVVMGHSQCGAVGATVDALERGEKPDSANVQSIVNFIAPNIKHLFEQPSSEISIRDAAVRVNAVASKEAVKRSSKILRGAIDEGRVQIVASVFDISTGLITFLDS